MPAALPRPSLTADRLSPGMLTGLLSGTQALEVHLQPIVDVATRQVWGVEALARFPGHPQPGPSTWFASASHDGRGPALEELALREALALLGRLPRGMRLTVNLSAEALLCARVQALLLDAADPRVVVELTEHEQVRDYPALMRALVALREVGIGLGIDDFGAGHSSLRHVLHLEPDVVKLDLALVQGVGQCRRRQALVEAMIGFCRSTDSLLVAEGVEDAEDLAQLTRLGVGYAQGWLLARPASPEVVVPALRGRFGPTVLVLP